MFAVLVCAVLAAMATILWHSYPAQGVRVRLQWWRLWRKMRRGHPALAAEVVWDLGQWSSSESRVYLLDKRLDQMVSLTRELPILLREHLRDVEEELQQNPSEEERAILLETQEAIRGLLEKGGGE
jgi:hypothetical protein